MPNFRLVVEYDGTDYHGFAVQRGLRTVQGELEKAIGAICGTRTRVAGSGRTDAGAHALAQVVSFRTESRIESLELRRALNATLPDDLVVKAADIVPDDFHARRSAQRRRYRYSIWNAEIPSVWTRQYRYHVRGALDPGAMNEAAECLVGTRDFGCFTFGLTEYLGAGKRRTTVRTLFEARWSGAGPDIVFDVVGTAFLPHMIRNIVGSLLRVGQGKRTPDEFKSLVERQAMELSTHTVPAYGLMLVGVDY